MADRYWVGGTGTWNTSSTTNWSETSGGSGGASVPTLADNVIIDSNSGTGTITSSGTVDCNDITVTASQALTLGNNNSFSVYGSLSLPTGGSFVWDTVVNFRATTTGKTLNWGDKTSTRNINFDGIGGGWTLASAMSVGVITVTNGNFSTNGFSVTALQLSSNNSNTRTINLGSSTVTLTISPPIVFTTTTNLTFNAGTSTIVSSVNAPSFSGGGLTYYNVSFTSTGSGAVAISSTNTFNTLSVTAPSSGTKNVNFANDQTISTLTTSGTTSVNRIQFGSSVAGTQRTLSVATIGTLTNTNWKDIALTGAASPWSAPAGVWNLGNNSGITFTTVTYYWVGGSGTWNQTSATNWAASSGGAGGAAIPGPNDNVIFDTNSGTGTITYSAAQTTAGYCNDFTVTASQALTFGTTSSGYINIYGSMAFPAGGSVAFSTSNSQYYYFYATSTGKTITLNGKDVRYMNFYFQSSTGSWTLQDAIIGGNAYINLNAGTFDTNGKTVAAYSFNASGTATLTLGASTFTSESGFTVVTTNTVNAGTSSITSKWYFAGGGKTYYNVTLYFIGFGSNESYISGANTFNNLTFTADASSYNPINVQANQTVNGTFSATGYSLTQRNAIRSDVIGTQRTITAAAGGTFSNVNFRDIVIAGAAAPISGTSIGNCLNNSGITFTAPKTVYWNLAGSQNITSTGWAATSGGVPAAANYPLPQDTAIFNNAGAAGTFQLGSDTFPSYFTDLPEIDCSARTTAVTFNFGNSAKYTVYKNFTLGTGVSITYGGNSYCYFYTDSTQTLTTNGVTFNLDRGLVSNTVGSGVFTLGSALTMPNIAIAFFNLGGNFNSNNYNITVPSIIVSAGTKTFGTSTVNVTYNNSQVVNASGYTLAAPAAFNLTYAGATGTRTVNCGAPAAGSDAIGVNITAGTDTVALAGVGLGSIDFTGFSGTLSNGSRTLLGNLTVSTGMTLTAGANTMTFGATSGTKTITTNGKTLDFPLTFNGVGGTWQLQDNLTVGATRAVTLTNGTLDTNSKTVASGTFSSSSFNVRTLTLGSTVWSIASTGTVWDCTSSTNMTLNRGTSEIILSSTSTTARTFAGGGLTYNKVTIGGATGTSTTTITGSNTFETFASTKLVAHTISITSGTTQTIGNWSINGTAGNIVTLGSTSTTNHTLTKSGGGTVTADYMSISRSTGTPSLTWLATNSTNGGNNVGWYFGSFPKGNTLFFGSNF